MELNTIVMTILTTIFYIVWIVSALGILVGLILNELHFFNNSIFVSSPKWLQPLKDKYFENR